MSGDVLALAEMVLQLQRELAETRAQMRNMLRTGTVAERDAQKGYRVDWGKDDQGKTILSPWYPHPEAGGTHKTWQPLTVGEIVTCINPGGDPRQGFLMRGGFGGTFQPPSASLDETVTSLHGGMLVETVTNGARTATLTGSDTATVTGAFLLTVGSGHLA